MFPPDRCVARRVAVKRGNTQLWMRWAVVRTCSPCTGFDFVSGANTAGGRLGKVKSCESKAARKSWYFVSDQLCAALVLLLFLTASKVLRAKLEKDANKGGEDQ